MSNRFVLPGQCGAGKRKVVCCATGATGATGGTVTGVTGPTGPTRQSAAFTAISTVSGITTLGAGETLVTGFDSAIVLTTGAYDGTISTYTAPFAADYAIEAHGIYTVPASRDTTTSDVSLVLLVNGGNVIESDNVELVNAETDTTTTLNVSTVVSLGAGDTVQAVLINNGSTPIILNTFIVYEFHGHAV